MFKNNIYTDFNKFKTSQIQINKQNRVDYKYKKINGINNIYKLENSKQNYKDKACKYFIMQPNKSSNHSKNKSNKKINYFQNNNIPIKRIDKKKLITKKKKNNIFIDINQTNKIYNKNNVNINNNINITNSFISKRIKKMALNEKNKKYKKIQSERYYILSEEADKMIKSYSKTKKLCGKNNETGRNKNMLTYNNSFINSYSNNSCMNK